MALSLDELVLYLQKTLPSSPVELVGEGSLKVNRIRTLKSAEPGDLSFLTKENYEKEILETKASALLVERSLFTPGCFTGSVLLMKNAYLGLAFLSHYLHPLTHPSFGIHPTAVIESSARLGANVQVGPHVYIGANCVVGEEVVLYPHVTLGEGVHIGAGSVLYPQVTVYAHCQIGEFCLIHAGTVIGSDGFGFATDEQARHHKIHQVGNVVIESHVEIGSNCSIDRGAQDSTVIGEGSKLDNLIQVAHGVKIGKNCLLVSQCGISGSTSLGEAVVVGGQVGITGHLKIEDRVQIGAQTGVDKSLSNPQYPKPMAYWGFPKALPIREAERNFVHVLRLPQYVERIKVLENQIALLLEQSQKKLGEGEA